MFVVALCRYLLLQEYKPEQITILTTYTGQLYCLRNLMPAKEFSGVKVHVVDKYQGEENDIVLLSLVRSNSHNKVGFLNIPNRVCVALSRAKKGLYCFGNSELLSKVTLWSNIFHTLRENEQVGKALTLCCQNHPDRQVEVTSAEGFNQAPEGGCIQPCQFRLDCGHVCTRVCHPYDQEHKKYKCFKDCQTTLCDKGHKCPLVCYEECPKKCPIRVQKIVPQCQHSQMIPCHQDPSTFPCQVRCPKLLQCGHPCDLTCGVLCTSKCKVKVPLQLKCGHSQEDACFYRTCSEEPRCRTPCKHQLKCGHTCQGTCGSCLQGRYHTSCLHQCKRLLICSHGCREPCTKDCPPCQKNCENCCFHSKCMKPCGQPCAPCKEPCAWKCPHLACSKLCHEPCDRPPCMQPCTNTLKCGHPCIGLCGDKCPSKCRICDHDEVTEIFFGTEDEPDAYFIQLEDCGHLFDYRGMDKYMGLDDDNHANQGEQVAIKLKECPRCRTPVRKNLRYGSQINRSLREIEMVKEKINGQQSDIEKYRATLIGQWKQNLCGDGIKDYMTDNYRDIFYRLDDNHITVNDLWILENKMDFYVKIAKLVKCEQERMRSMHASTFRLRIDEFERWLNSHNQRFSEQQAYDLQREMCRLNLLAELNVRWHNAGKTGPSAEAHSEVQDIREVLEKLGQFTEQDESRVKDAMKRLDATLPIKSLGITEEEKTMIVSAMKMRPGHWYKCPNGHVYVITECGGAMESRTCPDCDAVIGGESHTLASGNQVATEMDGSQHPAWSEANNLLNFMNLNI